MAKAVAHPERLRHLPRVPNRQNALDLGTELIQAPDPEGQQTAVARIFPDKTLRVGKVLPEHLQGLILKGALRHRIQTVRDMGRQSSQREPKEASNSSFIRQASSDSQNPGSLLFAAGGIRFSGKSAPSRLMTRASAEVPLRCMPHTRIASGDSEWANEVAGLFPLPDRGCRKSPSMDCCGAETE